MENARRTFAKITSGGFWPSLTIMAASALEFSWLDHVLGGELIAAILTLMTPLPIAPLLSRDHRRRHRSSGRPGTAAR
jgi:hypothetical protein